MLAWLSTHADTNASTSDWNKPQSKWGSGVLPQIKLSGSGPMGVGKKSASHLWSCVCRHACLLVCMNKSEMFALLVALTAVSLGVSGKISFGGRANLRALIHLPSGERRPPPRPVNATKVSPVSTQALVLLRLIFIHHQFWHLLICHQHLILSTCFDLCSWHKHNLALAGGSLWFEVWWDQSDPAAPPCLSSLHRFCSSRSPAHGFLLVFAPNIIPTATRGLLRLILNICDLGGASSNRCCFPQKDCLVRII